MNTSLSENKTRLLIQKMLGIYSCVCVCILESILIQRLLKGTVDASLINVPTLMCYSEFLEIKAKFKMVNNPFRKKM